MPYVKISDPNIIDLAAWHQLINVVNQHSDSINSITNNFGVQGTGSIDWEADADGVHEFVMGSEKILYGRTKIDTATALSNTGDQIFHGEIDFGDNVSGATTFSARPIVVSTIQFGNKEFSTLQTKNHNIVHNIFGVTKNKFNFRVTRAISTSVAGKTYPLEGFFYLNWQAIGPK
jgi:hypothetical protein